MGVLRENKQTSKQRADWSEGRGDTENKDGVQGGCLVDSILSSPCLLSYAWPLDIRDAPPVASLEAHIHTIRGNVLHVVKSVRHQTTQEQKKKKTYPCNNRPSPHSRPPPYPHPRKNNNIGGNPNIILDNHRLAILRPAVARPPSRIRTTRPSIDAHIRADNNIIPDANLTDIVDETVPANRHIVANLDVVPVVAGKRRLDDGIVANPACMRNRRHDGRREVDAFTRVEDVPKEPGAFGGGDANVGIGRVVESPACGVAPLPLEDKLLVEGVVGPSVEHLFLLTTGPLGGELRV